jgi:hypothetical protein
MDADIKQSLPLIAVNSFNELMVHENEILERINRVPNGGQLFLIHPFMLLQDISVQLSQQAKQEILQHVPELTGLSNVPYLALKNSREKQHINFHLRGLFKK